MFLSIFRLKLIYTLPLMMGLITIQIPRMVALPSTKLLLLYYPSSLSYPLSTSLTLTSKGL